jgi:universal stress protein E
VSNSDVKLRRIVVATDFSDSAASALKQALWIAERAGAEVIVVHVLSDLRSTLCAMPADARKELSEGNIHRFERALRANADARLESLLAPERGRPLKLRYETLLGVPFIETIRAVERESADLLLAGTRGLSRLKRFLVGSAAERLVRKCPCPVWIVKAAHAGPPKSVLVALDFSDVCAKALEFGAFMAGQSGAQLNVLHVFDVPAELTLLLDMNRDPTGTEFRLNRSKVKRAAAEKLREFVERRVPASANAHLHLARGEPSTVVTSRARKLAADLVVMGSVVRTGIPGFVIGNTAEKVLRTCDCSILTVKPDAFVSPIQPIFGGSSSVQHGVPQADRTLT